MFNYLLPLGPRAQHSACPSTLLCSGPTLPGSSLPPQQGTSCGALPPEFQPHPTSYAPDNSAVGISGFSKATHPGVDIAFPPRILPCSSPPVSMRGTCCPDQKSSTPLPPSPIQPETCPLIPPPTTPDSNSSLRCHCCGPRSDPRIITRHFDGVFRVLLKNNNKIFIHQIPQCSCPLSSPTFQLQIAAWKE